VALQIKREGATPNLLKYSVIADAEGGEIILSQEDLVRDSVHGPLRNYIARGVRLGDDAAACRYLLCNPSMRTFVTPRSFPPVAMDRIVSGATTNPAIKIMAEPNAVAIVALEFRHTLAA
jgi:hypothetical protein